MHRRTTNRTTPVPSSFVGVGAALLLLFAAGATIAGDQPAGPSTPPDREAFLAG